MCNKAECIWNTNGNDCKKPDLIKGTYRCVNGELIENKEERTE